MNPAEYRRMFDAEDSHWWYVSLHEFVRSWIRGYSEKIGESLRIFDAGCGTGRLCQLLEADGHTVSGCDFSAEAVELSRSRGVMNVSIMDLNEISLEPESFDVITSIDVLYHQWIRDDVKILSKFHKALKPGGILLLNLVAFEFLRSSHDIAVHTRERYTRGELIRRLEKGGFEEIETTYRVTLLFPVIAVIRFLKKRVRSFEPVDVNSDVSIPAPFSNRLLTAVMRFENRLLSRCSLPFGSSLFALARKSMKPENQKFFPS